MRAGFWDDYQLNKKNRIARIRHSTKLFVPSAPLCGNMQEQFESNKVECRGVPQNATVHIRPFTP